MRNLSLVELVDTPDGTSRRGLFRKALAAAAAVAGAGALFDFSRRSARAANGDPLTIGNTDPALLGPDTSSNATQLDKDDLNPEPTLVLTNANGDGLDSTGTRHGLRAQGARRGSIGVSGDTGVEGTGGATGVLGNGMNVGSSGVRGISTAANSFGVVGQGQKSGVWAGGPTGVEAHGTQIGVDAVASGPNSRGVNAFASGTGSKGVFAGGETAVLGSTAAQNGTGVWGNAGFASNGVGVIGTGGFGPNATGVLCQGKFVATGTKSAAVAHPDGSHRLLYCMESPECWFEDFGSGALAGGKASVALDPDFAAVVNTTDYHAFLTPEGDCRGLYVSSKGATGFTVNELQGGTGSLGFSYRVVARRKDVQAPRLAKYKLPALPDPGEVAGTSEPTRTPDLAPIEPAQVSAPPRRARR
jgi:hypothetical protein